MPAFLKCLAADFGIALAGVVIMSIGVVIRRIYFVPQNPYILLWVFVVITVVGFTMVARAGIHASSGAWEVIGIVGGSVVAWVAVFYAVSLAWINSYGT
jgi:hypothetical protein